MNKVVNLLETAQAIIDMADEIESLKLENVNLRDRLIHAQSETLAAIQQNEPKPEPRDIGHENVHSWVIRKSGELQVSPGIVWGLIMDLIAKNSDHFGTDADACPDPVEPILDEYEYVVGDKIIVVNDILNPGNNGKVFEIEKFFPNAEYPIAVKNYPILFNANEIELYTEPVNESGDDCGSDSCNNGNEVESDYEVRLDDIVKYNEKLTTVIGIMKYTNEYKLRGVSGYLKKDEFEFVQHAI